jgi:hypothetical protein
MTTVGYALNTSHQGHKAWAVCGPASWAVEWSAGPIGLSRPPSIWGDVTCRHRMHRLVSGSSLAAAVQMVRVHLQGVVLRAVAVVVELLVLRRRRLVPDCCAVGT